MSNIDVIVCNKCGKRVEYIDGILKEDFCYVKKEWGFFSKKDLKVHSFNLCEECYHHLIENFVIPVKISQKIEVLNEEKSFS